MRKQKMLLNEEIVKYIFPGMNVETAPCEGGCIVNGFKRLYPAKLEIFIPHKVDRSNYSSYFPKSFEEYFWDIHQEANFISRFWEGRIEPNVPNVGVECIPGRILERNETGYTVFRFDELLDPREKTDVLCRVNLNTITTDDKLEILNLDPNFFEEVWDFDDTCYQYWISPITRLFRINDEFLAAIFAFSNSLRMKNGPF